MKHYCTGLTSVEGEKYHEILMIKLLTDHFAGNTQILSPKHSFFEFVTFNLQMVVVNE